MNRRNRWPDVDLPWVIREIAKLTDKPFREIGEALTDDMLVNEESLSERDYTLGMSIAGDLENLWPLEGVFRRGPDAERALNLVKRVLQAEG